MPITITDEKLNPEILQEYFTVVDSHLKDPHFKRTLSDTDFCENKSVFVKRIGISLASSFKIIKNAASQSMFQAIMCT
ncbi:hypothetical protein KIN20_014148 [Parelaphostrongylus tenuis]|uniref:Uncharacterized protein n=1 Tax=Parelaphostrongylus tenuis TaxID=148309 RepID=A0AAD5N2V7_PARTN|nr:hypothetical protein KIN20_014148 [Parelaphostrongylus tenuis]